MTKKPYKFILFFSFSTSNLRSCDIKLFWKASSKCEGLRNYKLTLYDLYSNFSVSFDTSTEASTPAVLSLLTSAALAIPDQVNQHFLTTPPGCTMNWRPAQNIPSFSVCSSLNKCLHYLQVTILTSTV